MSFFLRVILWRSKPVIIGMLTEVEIPIVAVFTLIAGLEINWGNYVTFRNVATEG